MSYGPVNIVREQLTASVIHIDRERYLSSNLGKARAHIAKADRAAQRVIDLLCDVSAGLTRGDGSEVDASEELRRAELDLRLLTDQVRDLVALHHAETELKQAGEI